MHTYLANLIKDFEANADPDYAVSMKKYMKNHFDFYGIRSPLRKEIGRNHIRRSGLPDAEQFEEIMFECWKSPQREIQYFALELAGRLAKKAELCRIDLYEFMIQEKSWWDSVDYISPNLVGVHFKTFPDAIDPYTSRWMESGNIWLQRSCVLFQLKYKQAVDVDLLVHFIKHLEGSKEFFINKAIGWMLREYSKTNASWVIDYVENNANSLAPLSYRESLKWLWNRNLLPKK